jgi:hypothetical protein
MGKNRPSEICKIELKFWKIIYCMEDTAYLMVYGDGKWNLPHVLLNEILKFHIMHSHAPGAL